MESWGADGSPTIGPPDRIDDPAIADREDRPLRDQDIIHRPVGFTMRPRAAMATSFPWWREPDFEEYHGRRQTPEVKPCERPYSKRRARP